MISRQATDTVFLVRPRRFGANAQTAATNSFQDAGAALRMADAQPAAIAEFDTLRQALEQEGVRVHVYDDRIEPHTPDSIFPNNWVSFHADGTVVLYPMLAPNRRLERRQDILDDLAGKHGFDLRRVVDLTRHELDGHYLEGTGSLVLDRVNRIAYACLSPRTRPEVLADFASRLGFEIVAFEALDGDGAAVYHTNVVMCVGTRFAAVCLDAIRADQREAVRRRIEETGHRVLSLSTAQMQAFAGNMLELRGAGNKALLILSARALDSLRPDQRQLLDDLGLSMIAVPIPTIEDLGGGSARCMIAEIFLPE